jgi:hypothetical protein
MVRKRVGGSGSAAYKRNWGEIQKRRAPAIKVENSTLKHSYSVICTKNSTFSISSFALL